MREIYGTSEPPTVSPRQQLELQQQPFLTGPADVNVDGGKHIANENVGMDEEGIASSARLSPVSYILVLGVRVDCDCYSGGHRCRRGRGRLCAVVGQEVDRGC